MNGAVVTSADRVRARLEGSVRTPDDAHHTAPHTVETPAEEIKPLRARKSRPFSALAAEIYAFTKKPRWSWGFPNLDREAPVPAGSLVTALGPTGRGKSAFAIGIARSHARTLGPAIVFSAELAGAIAGARAVAQVTHATWFQVLSGGLSEADIATALDEPRLRIVDEVTTSWPADIEAEILAAQAEHPGEIVLVTVDYLQIMPSLGLGRDVREQVTAASACLRDIAKRTGAVILLLSKMSRSMARAARNGESVGSDATEGGAETNGIEHDAIAQIQLGLMKPADPDDPDGPRSTVYVSVAKARFGRGDVVIPFEFDGAHGTFREVGEAVSAAAVRAETSKKGNSDGKVAEATLKVRGHLAAVREEVSRNDIVRVVKGNRQDALAAIGEMLASGELVEVMGRKKPATRGGETFWPLALVSRLADLGLRRAQGAP